MSRVRIQQNLLEEVGEKPREFYEIDPNKEIVI